MISFTAKAHCQPHRCAAPTIPMPTITTTDRTCVSASSTHSARPSLKWTAMASKSRLCLVCQLVRRTSKKEPSWKERWSACCKQSHCRSGAESPEASDLLWLRGVQEEPKLQLKPALTSTSRYKWNLHRFHNHSLHHTSWERDDRSQEGKRYRRCERNSETGLHHSSSDSTHGPRV